ncbi:hypothetical protein METBIDRAFT_37624 [Metschnikowia bicuspidata var. bicuspidata NRRL YB-4993]|uniref:DUF1746 domain-containing protein n=1 Tax=Metschnikowia bicuspidata var. bicuspidata NRRL YB-4993 TaxID=869754 RepID=A0A1A0HJK7_9ASCO|nr:hypothetical protein METBIDRAFT_37624 [Metschnikowia bicuspidata var. bicuspidata NRRL YB-4993]OBA24349.1 hypothetical protein METBIDRAFT_37624 [Metschnikowia bicuspidata var. bicuspidata NRRL YB-4993]
MPDLFTSLRYPSVEETLRNNASLLIKQKRLFLADLRTLMGTLGCALIGILYLRDMSILLFCLRATVQFLLSSPYAAHFNYGTLLQEEARKEQRWFLFWSVVLVNGVSFLDHLILGTYRTSSAGDRQLHGSWTVQFIGERLPRGRSELVVFDGLIVVMQLVYFCLMCTTSDLAVLQGPLADLSLKDEAVLLDVVSDGFDGNVHILTVDVWEGVRALWRYDRHPENRDVQELRSMREQALRRILV